MHSYSHMAVMATIAAITASCTQGSDDESPKVSTIRTESDLAAYAGTIAAPGHLTISCEDCTSLDALSALRTIEGDLRIENNPRLASIEGLAALGDVSSIHISDNPALLSIDGLIRIAALRELHILRNSALQNIDGLRGVTTSTDYIEISANENLQSIKGLSSLASAGYFRVVGNPTLANMSGFASLTTIELDFTVNFNNSLLHMDHFPSLQSVGQSLILYENSSLASVARKR